MTSFIKKTLLIALFSAGGITQMSFASAASTVLEGLTAKANLSAKAGVPVKVRRMSRLVLVPGSFQVSNELIRSYENGTPFNDNCYEGLTKEQRVAALERARQIFDRHISVTSNRVRCGKDVWAPMKPTGAKSDSGAGTES